MRVKVDRTVGLLPHPAIHHAMNVVSRVIHAHTGRHARITGLQEEGHSENSLHYGIPGDVRYRAFDFDADTDHIPAEKWDAIDAELRARLGCPWEFQLVWESMGGPNAHGHVEFDPKVFRGIAPSRA